MILFTVLGLATVGYVVFAFDRSAGRVEEQRQTVVTEQALGQVSDPLAALCAENPTIKARVGAACDTAAAVVSAPADSPADGLDGRDGVNGRDGTNGLNGKDGLTPPCLATPTMCVGADGKDGLDGKDGQNGTDGADGANGTNGTDGTDGRDGSPAAELIVNRADGTQLRCPRTGGEDTAPVYTCAAA